MKNIHILLFGKLKDSWSEAHFDWRTKASSIEELYTEILVKAKDIPHKASIKVAINDEFAHWDSLINEGDTLAFLPPASGG